MGASFDNLRAQKNISDIFINGDDRLDRSNEGLNIPVSVNDEVVDGRGELRDRMDYTPDISNINLPVDNIEQNRADTGELDEEDGTNNISQIQVHEKELEPHELALQRDFEKKQTKKAEKSNRFTTCCADVACVSCITKKDSIKYKVTSNMRPITKPKEQEASDLLPSSQFVTIKQGDEEAKFDESDRKNDSPPPKKYQTLS